MVPIRKSCFNWETWFQLEFFFQCYITQNLGQIKMKKKFQLKPCFPIETRFPDWNHPFKIHYLFHTTPHHTHTHTHTHPHTRTHTHTHTHTRGHNIVSDGWA